jgi:transcriptional regulator with XRE-family HTH domain
MSLLRRVLGNVLRRVRLRQGRTLREVAEAAGVSVPYLSEVERGRKEASSEILAAICQALGLHLADLLEAARDDLRRLEPRRTPAGPRLRHDRPTPRLCHGRPTRPTRLTDQARPPCPRRSRQPVLLRACPAPVPSA